MSPSGKEESTKKTGVPPEPLCLFCFPEETCTKTYVGTLPPREGDAEEASGRRGDKGREDCRAKRRTETRIRRRRMKEPVRNLRSFLLASVRNENLGARLPSLYEVLETVKDAWPSPSRRNVRTEHQSKHEATSKMKDEIPDLQLPRLLNRRLSMPEELIRKDSVKEKTSEESETNKTAADVSPSSSSTLETTRRRDEQQPTKADACQQTDDAEKPKNGERRVRQKDYYKQGQRIIKVKTVDVCTCQSSASPKEETDDSGTTESVPSSSPTQLPKRESSSGNLSSESDNLRCTCAELSSKETSTDLFHSGKSTLSQTVSDKSMSTQDSTVSINSVSTRGSTVSDHSDSTTPERERTSAKETTTSPDYSPRTPRNRKNRRKDKRPEVIKDRSRTCPKHSRCHLVNNYSNNQCPMHSETKKPKATTNAATNTDEQPTTQATNTDKPEKVEEDPKPQIPEPYKWAKLTPEELYMMQQLRHRRFVETHAVPQTPIPAPSCGSAYPPTECIERPIMIPRYSALPRTLSMLVNTSSPESHNSDSDSLADSLEDQPVTHVHKLYFDTKKESKPVRGDATVLEEKKQKQRHPRGRAFFVSIKQPFGEDEMLESIEKIPQPPDKIKNQIFERHLNLCAKHKHQKSEEQNVKVEGSHKKRKPTTHDSKIKKNTQDEKKKLERKPKRHDEDKQKQEQPTGKKKEGKTRSKIPVLVSSRSGSSSPEREQEKPTRPKNRLKRQKEDAEPPPREVETTQILEITQSGTELSLQKPQAVIHPSQVPLEAKPQLTMPPLPSGRPPPRPTWNKQILLARRSPVGKFRQRFEVIPEEKSSSLSSAEEKNEGRSKSTDAATSPLPSDGIQFQSYNVNEVPNLIVAKITNKQLETLPYVKDSDNQKIILFSSKPQNSAKGRDALIAMNREDFNRLAKGWMNFYKLNENFENSENEDKPETKKQNNEKPPKTDGNPTTKQQKENSCLKQEPELGDNVRLDCSNTILPKPKPLSDSSRSLKKQNSLPELKVPGQKVAEVHKSTSFGSLPRVAKHLEDDDTDSDSTDYMEPPSPRVPPLPIDDIPSDGTLSSSDSELNSSKPQKTTQSLKYLQFKKRTAVSKKGSSFETSRTGKKKNSGWSVTVAGTVELSRSAPELEMRLSFPANGGPPVVSQSDSGFAEDSNYSKLSESLQDLDSYLTKEELPSGNLKQKWMVTVKNPKKGDRQDLGKQFPSSNPVLPDLEPPQSRNSKKVLKDGQVEEKVRRLVERKMRAIWPKVQKAIRKEFLTESGRLITECEDEDGSCLSVRGSAVSLERKRKPPTMTERDVTRRYTARTGDYNAIQPSPSF